MLCGLRLKKHIIFTYDTLLLLLSLLHLSETLLFLQNFTKLIILKSEVCSDWPAIKCVVIGPIPQAYDENVTPLTILGNTQSLHNTGAGAVHVAAGRVVHLMVRCFVCLSVYCHFRI